MYKNINAINELFEDVEGFGLQAEVITAALNIMKNDNSLTDIDAFKLAMEEYDII